MVIHFLMVSMTPVMLSLIPACDKPIKIANFTGVADTGNASLTGVNKHWRCTSKTFASSQVGLKKKSVKNKLL
jgi:hypothetical protein